MWNYLVSLGLILLQAPGPIPTATPSSTPLPSSESSGFGSFLWLILGIVIGFIIGILTIKAFGKSGSHVGKEPPSLVSLDIPPRAGIPAKSLTPSARRCPVCNSTYTDEALIYCVSDGASLVSVKGSSVDDPGATPLNRDLPPTEAYRPNEPIK